MWLVFISLIPLVSGMRGQIALADGSFLGIHKISSVPSLEVVHQHSFYCEDKDSKQKAITWAESLNYTIAPITMING